MLSIVLPSYRVASTLRKELPPLMAFLDTKGIHREIIIVDDGSGDDGETARVATEHGCACIAFRTNRGKGAAVRAGVLAAAGDFIIFTDADIPFAYDALPHVLHYLDFKEFDVVTGDRTLPGSSYFSRISGMRRIGSSVFSFLVGRFVTTGIFDTQCGLKGFRRDAALKLFRPGRINGYAFDVELLYLALKFNMDIKRLPVALRSNEHSTVSLLRHAPGMFLDVFRIKWNHMTGKYASHT